MRVEELTTRKAVSLQSLADRDPDTTALAVIVPRLMGKFVRFHIGSSSIEGVPDLMWPSDSGWKVKMRSGICIDVALDTTVIIWPTAECRQMEHVAYHHRN